MNTKRINFTELFIYIVSAELTGVLSALASGNSWVSYETLVKPPLSPPAAVFPIVWTALYALMGASAYIAAYSAALTADKRKALRVYRIQLGVNFLWSIVYFRFGLQAAGAAVIALLAVLALYMLRLFYGIRPLSACLSIPYAVWLIFALYLNIGTAVLNPRP